LFIIATLFCATRVVRAGELRAQCDGDVDYQETQGREVADSDKRRNGVQRAVAATAPLSLGVLPLYSGMPVDLISSLRAASRAPIAVKCRRSAKQGVKNTPKWAAITGNSVIGHQLELGRASERRHYGQILEI